MSMIDHPAGSRPVHPVLWAMIALMVGLELMFHAVAAGLLPAYLGRLPVFIDFAFWDQMFDMTLSGQAVYPQVWWSPLTYAFLHGGWLHLAFNGAAFLALGHALEQSVGIRRVLVIFVVCAVAGALTFGLISNLKGPMVGASGAIFGFLAVVTAWQEKVLREAGLSRAPIWRRIFALVLLNVALAFGMGGLLAWQDHLGGWIAGWILAYVFPPRGGIPMF